jgi:hypothetical protein
MKLTKELIRQHAGPGVKISSRFPFAGYEIQTPTGGRAVVTEGKIADIEGGADIWDIVGGLSGAPWGSVTVGGRIGNIAHAVQAGRKLGVPVEAGGTKRFFGLLKPPRQCSLSLPGSSEARRLTGPLRSAGPRGCSVLGQAKA